jgi:hypothetical protein
MRRGMRRRTLMSRCPHPHTAARGVQNENTKKLSSPVNSQANINGDGNLDATDNKKQKTKTLV